MDSGQRKQRLPQQHGQYLSTQRVHIRAYPSPKPPLSGIKSEKFIGCNSRICTNCGKNHTDKWAKSLGNALFNVPHRHAVLTIPDALWPIVRRNRFLHKVLMDAAIAAINDTISYKHRTHRPTFQEIPRGILRSSHKRIQNHKQTDEG